MVENKKKWYKRWWAITLFIFLGFGIIGSFISEEEGTITTQKETATQPEIAKEETKEIIIKQESGKLIMITLKDDGVENPDIWEDYVVFNNKGGNGNVDIYLYTISTGKIKRITYDNSAQTNPRFEDEKIYWQDGREVRPNIMWFYDLKTGKEDSTNRDTIQFLEDEYRSCYSTKCVYEEKYMVSHKEFVPDGRCPECGDWIGPVYENFDVFLLDKRTNSITQLTNDTYYDQKEPHIWNNKIIWSDNRNGKNNFDIFIYDLDTKKETQITFSPDASESNPVIYGNYIVYLKYKKGEDKGFSGYDYSNEVAYYDLTTKKEIVISGTKDFWKKSLKIYENKIVWHTCRNSWCASKDEVIYLYII